MPATRIWALLNLELWHRTFIDGEGIQTLARACRSRPRAESARHAAAARLDEQMHDDRHDQPMVVNR